MVLVSIVVLYCAVSVLGMRLWSVVLVCCVSAVARAGWVRRVLVITLLVTLVLLVWCGVGMCAMLARAEGFFCSAFSRTVASLSVWSNFWQAWHGVAGDFVGPRVRPWRAARSQRGWGHMLVRCLAVLGLQMHFIGGRFFLVRGPAVVVQKLRFIWQWRFRFSWVVSGRGCLGLVVWRTWADVTADIALFMNSACV